MTLIERIISVWGIFAIIGIVLTFHGLYLAFSASILIGFIVLFVEPAPLILSLIYLGWGKNLAEIAAKWLSS